MSSLFHLAQLNVALPREPLGSELLAGFEAALDPVNAAADASPGFVWRLQTGEGDATGIRGFGDDRLIINMSVWESLESLRAFAYSCATHRSVLRRRREWFERMDVYLALWWVPVGHEPDLDEAEERLELLRRLGPTPEAFTFRTSFGPPEGRGATSGDAPLSAVEDERELCPAG